MASVERAFQELVEVVPALEACESLFSSVLKIKGRAFHTQDELITLNHRISDFFILVGPCIFNPAFEVCVDHLFEKFKAHQFNVDDVLRCLFPVHDSPLYAKILHILKIDDRSQWLWLKTASKANVSIKRSLITQACCRNPTLFKFFCETASMVADRCATFFASNTSVKHPYISFFMLLSIDVFALQPRDVNLHVTSLLPFIVRAGEKPRCPALHTSALALISELAIGATLEFTAAEALTDLTLSCLRANGVDQSRCIDALMTVNIMLKRQASLQLKNGGACHISEGALRTIVRGGDDALANWLAAVEETETADMSPLLIAIVRRILGVTDDGSRLIVTNPRVIKDSISSLSTALKFTVASESVSVAPRTLLKRYATPIILAAFDGYHAALNVGIQEHPVIFDDLKQYTLDIISACDIADPRCLLTAVSAVSAVSSRVAASVVPLMDLIASRASSKVLAGNSSGSRPRLVTESFFDQDPSIREQAVRAALAQLSACLAGADETQFISEEAALLGALIAPRLADEADNVRAVLIDVEKKDNSAAALMWKTVDASIAQSTLITALSTQLRAVRWPAVPRPGMEVPLAPEGGFLPVSSSGLNTIAKILKCLSLLRRCEPTRETAASLIILAANVRGIVVHANTVSKRKLNKDEIAICTALSTVAAAHLPALSPLLDASIPVSLESLQFAAGILIPVLVRDNNKAKATNSVDANESQSPSAPHMRGEAWALTAFLSLVQGVSSISSLENLIVDAVTSLWSLASPVRIFPSPALAISLLADISSRLVSSGSLSISLRTTLLHLSLTAPQLFKTTLDACLASMSSVSLLQAAVAASAMAYYSTKRSDGKSAHDEIESAVNAIKFSEQSLSSCPAASLSSVRALLLPLIAAPLSSSIREAAISLAISLSAINEDQKTTSKDTKKGAAGLKSLVQSALVLNKSQILLDSAIGLSTIEAAVAVSSNSVAAIILSEWTHLLAHDELSQRFLIDSRFVPCLAAQVRHITSEIMAVIDSVRKSANNTFNNLLAATLSLGIQLLSESITNTSDPAAAANLSSSLFKNLVIPCLQAETAQHVECLLPTLSAVLSAVASPVLVSRLLTKDRAHVLMSTISLISSDAQVERQVTSVAKSSLFASDLDAKTGIELLTTLKNKRAEEKILFDCLPSLAGRTRDAGGDLDRFIEFLAERTAASDVQKEQEANVKNATNVSKATVEMMCAGSSQLVASCIDSLTSLLQTLGNRNAVVKIQLKAKMAVEAAAARIVKFSMIHTESAAQLAVSTVYLVGGLRVLELTPSDKIALSLKDLIAIVMQKKPSLIHSTALLAAIQSAGTVLVANPNDIDEGDEHDDEDDDEEDLRTAMTKAFIVEPLKAASISDPSLWAAMHRSLGRIAEAFNPSKTLPTILSIMLSLTSDPSIRVMAAQSQLTLAALTAVSSGLAGQEIFKKTNKTIKQVHAKAINLLNSSDQDASTDDSDNEDENDTNSKEQQSISVDGIELRLIAQDTADRLLIPFPHDVQLSSLASAISTLAETAGDIGQDNDEEDLQVAVRAMGTLDYLLSVCHKRLLKVGIPSLDNDTMDSFQGREDFDEDIKRHRSALAGVASLVVSLLRVQRATCVSSEETSTSVDNAAKHPAGGLSSGVLILAGSLLEAILTSDDSPTTPVAVALLALGSVNVQSAAVREPASLLDVNVVRLTGFDSSTSEGKDMELIAERLLTLLAIALRKCDVLNGGSEDSEYIKVIMPSSSKVSKRDDFSEDEEEESTEDSEDSEENKEIEMEMNSSDDDEGMESDSDSESDSSSSSTSSIPAGMVTKKVPAHPPQRIFLALAETLSARLFIPFSLHSSDLTVSLNLTSLAWRVLAEVVRISAPSSPSVVASVIVPHAVASLERCAQAIKQSTAGSNINRLLKEVSSVSRTLDSLIIASPSSLLSALNPVFNALLDNANSLASVPFTRSSLSAGPVAHPVYRGNSSRTLTTVLKVLTSLFDGCGKVLGPKVDELLFRVCCVPSILLSHRALTSAEQSDMDVSEYAELKHLCDAVSNVLKNAANSVSLRQAYMSSDRLMTHLLGSLSNVSDKFATSRLAVSTRLLAASIEAQEVDELTGECSVAPMAERITSVILKLTDASAIRIRALLGKRIANGQHTPFSVDSQAERAARIATTLADTWTPAVLESFGGIFPSSLSCIASADASVSSLSHELALTSRGLSLVDAALAKLLVEFALKCSDEEITPLVQQMAAWVRGPFLKFLSTTRIEGVKAAVAEPAEVAFAAIRLRTFALSFAALSQSLGDLLVLDHLAPLVPDFAEALDAIIANGQATGSQPCSLPFFWFETGIPVLIALRTAFATIPGRIPRIIIDAVAAGGVRHNGRLTVGGSTLAARLVQMLDLLVEMPRIEVHVGGKSQAEIMGVELGVNEEDGLEEQNSEDEEERTSLSSENDDDDEEDSEIDDDFSDDELLDEDEDADMDADSIEELGETDEKLDGTVSSPTAMTTLFYRHLRSTIAELAASIALTSTADSGPATRDAHMKALIELLVEKCRHENANVRAAATEILRAVWDRSGLSAISGLSECLSTLADLLDDSDNVVERAARRLLKVMEKITGESLRSRLRH